MVVGGVMWLGVTAPILDYCAVPEVLWFEVWMAWMAVCGGLFVSGPHKESPTTKYIL